MVDYVVMSKEVGDIGSLELLKKTIFFRKKVDVSSLEDEEMVIFQVCLRIDRFNLAIPPDSSSSYLYFYLHFLKGMRIRFPFSPFEAEVLRVLNFLASQLEPNCCGFVRAFEIVCQGLEVPPNVGMFLSFYATRSSKRSWVTLCGLLIKALFKPYSNYYKNWRDKFVRVKGREGSQVVVGVDETPLFSLPWT